MKIGLFQTVQWPEGSEQGQRYNEFIEQCMLADELGYHSIWLTEHHFSRHGITSDSMALLSHLAARTTRIRLGTAVLVLPFHDPIRLAESSALVDHLSGGRLDVGVGRGYQWTEYHGFGVRFDEGSDRFEEALGLLVDAWRADEPFAFDGKYHRYDAAFPQPRPLQQPHPPLWHATSSDGGLRRCAERDWGVLLAQATSLALVNDIATRYGDHVRAAGATMRPDRLVLARGMYCGQSDAEAEELFLPAYSDFLAAAARVAAAPGQEQLAAPHNPFELADGTRLLDTVLSGNPDTCARALERLADIGIEHVLLFVNVAGLRHEDVVRSLRLFAAEVRPRFS
jgi:alkanesulfonate monooxygenase SsuD/methylene tetrahydromethanopterin reductase-like flavin-dependent oxidoreductase (luciferase family)